MDTPAPPTISPAQLPVLAQKPARKSVTDAVLAVLGRPADLFRVDAKRTWGDHFRVNVYCDDNTGNSVRCVRITDSFFVTFSDDGLVSDPPLIRKY